MEERETYLYKKKEEEAQFGFCMFKNFDMCKGNIDYKYVMPLQLDVLSDDHHVCKAVLCMSKAFQVGEVKGVVVSHQVGQVCLLNTFT
jgi:hypothetical protein